jgi:hypothetical protein
VGFTVREFWFLVHLGLGVMWVHAFAGGIAGLVGRRTSRLKELVRMASTVGMALIAWLAVITGTYLVYPGYRAEPPAAATDLSAYPREALLADDDVAAWHTFGMEWKEHVSWLTPFLATAIAFIVLQYGARVTTDPRMRKALAGLFLVAAGGALVAAAFGAAINAIAPNEFLDLE